MTSLGRHCILELHGCPAGLLSDIRFVREAVVQASRRGLSTLIKLSEHEFSPHGVTVVGLLAESHLSVHTWPEHGYVAVDMFTCGDAEPERACDYLAERFAAREHSLTILRRGDPEGVRVIFDQHETTSRIADDRRERQMEPQMPADASR